MREKSDVEVTSLLKKGILTSTTNVELFSYINYFIIIVGFIFIEFEK